MAADAELRICGTKLQSLKELRKGTEDYSTVGKLTCQLLQKHNSMLTFHLLQQNTRVLISPQTDQEEDKPMFLSEWREFPSASCHAGKET